MKNLHRDQLDKYAAESTALNNRVSALTQRANNEKREALSHYFQDGYSENFKVRVSNEYVEINNFENSSLLTFYINTSWANGNSRLYNSIELSMSSQRYEISDNPILREKRNVIEHYTNIAGECKEYILADLNNIASKYNKLIETFSTKRKELRELIEAQKRIVDSLDKDKLANELLNKGIKVKLAEYPRSRNVLQAKANYSINNVTSINATKISPSGKSADLIVTTKHDKTLHTQRVLGVRFSNIERFINNYQDLLTT
tara:strand:+ start:1763 stop:2539 length:777 start_codon:yes stop_codon:yes gene_type:complete